MNIVKELRKKKGVQQKELALTLGVSQPTISDWEANKKDPSGERLKKLADFFGVDELMILGKGVVDIAHEQPYQAKTEEARILVEGIDRLPKEQREQALNVVRAMFSQYADYFEKGNHVDDT